MIVVSDSTVLIGLSKIGRTELLQKLFKEIYIPNAVFKEKERLSIPPRNPEPTIIIQNEKKLVAA